MTDQKFVDGKTVAEHNNREKVSPDPRPVLGLFSSSSMDFAYRIANVSGSMDRSARYIPFVLVWTRHC